MRDARPYLRNRIKTLDLAIEAATSDIRNLFEKGAAQNSIDNARYFRDEFANKRDAFYEILDYLNQTGENE